jgi:ribosomal protein S27AE
MNRECTRCGRPFALADMSREETQNMEAQRKANGLEGVRFLYFHCPGCGMDDIFVAILPLDTEFAEDYEARREAMEKVVRSLHADGVEVVVVPVKAP